MPAVSHALAIAVLILGAHGDTAEPCSPFDAWDAPPAEGSLDGQARGSASLSSDRFEVQRKVSVRWIYTAGPEGLGPGEGLRVEDPLLHGMRWSKYGSSVLDAAHCSPLNTEVRGFSNGLVTASSSSDAVVLGLARNTEGAELHQYAYTDLWIEEGELLPGEELGITFGDTSGGSSCGHQTPDRAFEGVPWRGWEHSDGRFVPLEPSPLFSTDAIQDPALLWVSAPSVLGPDEPARLTVAVLDRLGNPIPAPGLEVEVEEAYGAATLELGQNSPGWAELELDPGGPGVHRIALRAGSLEAVSNPILVRETEPEERVFWGDLHSHHGHTRVHEDGERVNENHLYARDTLGWDFGCESMKVPPTEIDGEALWADLQRACEADSEEGSYIALVGFEYMGEGRDDGHHNVYFDDCRGFLPHQSELEGLDGEGGLLERVAAEEQAGGMRAVVIPHAGPWTGFQWRAEDPEHRVAAEVYSGWGNSLEEDDLGSVEHALALGQRMGFIAASDSHDGWFGNPLGRLGQPAGIAALVAPSLDRGALFDALTARRSYATTGARILLDVRAELDSGPQAAGQLLVTELPELSWSVHATAPVRSLEIRGVAPGEHAQAYTLYREKPGGALDLEGGWAQEGWKGRTVALWLRVVQEDGQIAWSSPTWFTSVCDKEGAQDPDGLCEGWDPQGGQEGGCGGCAGAPGGRRSLLWALLGAALIRRRDNRGRG